MQWDYILKIIILWKLEYLAEDLLSLKLLQQDGNHLSFQWGA